MGRLTLGTMRSQLGTASGSFIPISVARMHSFCTAAAMTAGHTNTPRERCTRGAAASPQMQIKPRFVVVQLSSARSVSTFTCVSSVCGQHAIALLNCRVLPRFCVKGRRVCHAIGQLQDHLWLSVCDSNTHTALK